MAKDKEVDAKEPEAQTIPPAEDPPAATADVGSAEHAHARLDDLTSRVEKAERLLLQTRGGHF